MADKIKTVTAVDDNTGGVLPEKEEDFTSPVVIDNISAMSDTARCATEAAQTAILDAVEAVEDDLSKYYELTEEDKVSSSLSAQDDIMEAVEVIREEIYALAIMNVLDEGGNEEDEAEVGSDSQTSESIIAEAIEAARVRMTGTVVESTFGDEDMHRKDEEDKDYVQVAHEDNEGIIITPFDEAITAANEVFPSKEEELVTVSEERTEHQEKVFNVITRQCSGRLTTEMESGISALAKIPTSIAAESTRLMTATTTSSFHTIFLTVIRRWIKEFPPYRPRTI